MTRRAQSLLVLSVLLSAAACLSPTEAEDLSISMQVSEMTTPPAKDTAFDNSLPFLIGGVMLLPDQCYQFRIDGLVQAREMTIVVGATKVDPPCTATSSGRAYSLIVNSVLPSNLSRIVIKHHTVDSRGDLTTVVADWAGPFVPQ